MAGAQPCRLVSLVRVVVAGRGVPAPAGLFVHGISRTALTARGGGDRVRRLHHLELDGSKLAGNGEIGRYILLPGSTDRAARIARRFEDLEVVQNRRRLDVHLGRLVQDGVSIDVAAIPTGMGCPSVDIVVGELLQAGARRCLRVGTAGSLQPDVQVGDVVVASGAVRDESASDAYTDPRFPALSDPLWVEALSVAATELALAERVHVGIVHSKDSFFGREFGQGPDGERNKAYMERLDGAGGRRLGDGGGAPVRARAGAPPGIAVGGGAPVVRVARPVRRGVRDCR